MDRWILDGGFILPLLADLFTTGIYEISSLFLGFVIAAIPLVISLEEKDANPKASIPVLFFLL